MNTRTNIERERIQKSPSHLLLLPIAFGFAGVICYGLVQIASLLNHGGFSGFREPIKTLIVIPFLLASLPCGLIMSNLVAWSVPSLRRYFDREAKGRRNGSFRASMRGLLMFAKYWTTIFTAIGFAAALLGR